MRPCCPNAEQPYRQLQGDSPLRYPALRIESHRPGHAPDWRLFCSTCGARWQVVYIPGGGIYGDFDWIRIDPQRGASEEPTPA